MSTRSFLGLKRPGCNVVHTLHLVMILRKEYRYLYSPCVSSWPVLGRPLPLQPTQLMWPLISFVKLLVTSVPRHVTQHHVCGQTWPSRSTGIVTYYIFCGIPSRRKSTWGSLAHHWQGPSPSRAQHDFWTSMSQMLTNARFYNEDVLKQDGVMSNT
jgi:hypothetical protein